MVGCAAPTLPAAHATRSSGHVGPLGPPGSVARREAVLLAAPHVPSGSDCSWVALQMTALPLLLCQRVVWDLFSVGILKTYTIKENYNHSAGPWSRVRVHNSQRAALYNHDQGALFQPPDLAQR